MNLKEQLSYYSKQLVKLMNQYETSTGRLFGDDFEELEKSIWYDIDTENLKKAKIHYNRLIKLVDGVAQ